ncbi:MAG: histidine kinase [Sideroxyarcus sp.]
MKSKIRRIAALCITLPGSVAIGLTLAFTITGGSWSDGYALKAMTIGLFFGLIGVITFLLFERIEMEAAQRELIKGESEKREIEANLKMLQAQIEPHFLFNTLANVSSLIDSDPVLAKRLLERLNDWLRVALVRARSDKATLGDELDMLENYLQILKIRFGERLRWRIDVPEAARLSVFPPMLLQPLVENAVRHGIEPKIGGGEIGIRATIDAATLCIEVCDTGVGLVGDEGGGAGLANVRARLSALFGAAGKLTLESKAGGGVCATLELPK